MHLLDLLVFGVGLALAVLGVSYPLLRLTRLIRHRAQQQCAMLTLGVLAGAIWLALLGYLFVPAHVFVDTAARGGDASLWTMHAEERLIARTYPADDSRRINAEAAVADERSWYISRSVMLTLLVLLVTVGGYAGLVVSRVLRSAGRQLLDQRRSPPAPSEGSRTAGD